MKSRVLLLNIVLVLSASCESTDIPSSDKFINTPLDCKELELIAIGTSEFKRELPLDCGCDDAPSIQNGQWTLDKDKFENGLYKRGTVAFYTCNHGYHLEPPESKMRVCEKGIWTGSSAICTQDDKINNEGCILPHPLSNGYLDYDLSKKEDDFIEIGQVISFVCASGYDLVGPEFIKCNSDKKWVPQDEPKCIKKFETPSSSGVTCDSFPTVPYGTTNLTNGIAEISCVKKYRDTHSPCQKSTLKCINGHWVGSFPSCVPVRECLTPPSIKNAVLVDISYENNYDAASLYKYPIQSKVTYQCKDGYSLDTGTLSLTCQNSGCWEPYYQSTLCKLATTDQYVFAMTTARSALVSAAAGLGVLSLLGVFCLAVACRRRRKARAARGLASGSSQNGSQVRTPTNDHAILIGRTPDRLALIAFADGVSGSQHTLPTYEEAVRNERNTSVTNNSNLTVSGRLHRPHWPSLGGRRTRNSPNPDVIHIVRHGSFASHTPSTRSGGDSMGSTDTVAISEGSTNVTLDTASSHSGSQNPSCRVHCGSLASFDTCSVINTEDVPLLEENEIEDIQGGNNEADNPIVSDNTSSKISTNSAPILGA